MKFKDEQYNAKQLAHSLKECPNDGLLVQADGGVATAAAAAAAAAAARKVDNNLSDSDSDSDSDNKEQVDADLVIKKDIQYAARPPNNTSHLIQAWEEASRNAVEPMPGDALDVADTKPGAFPMGGSSPPVPNMPPQQPRTQALAQATRIIRRDVEHGVTLRDSNTNHSQVLTKAELVMEDSTLFTSKEELPTAQLFDKDGQDRHRESRKRKQFIRAGIVIALGVVLLLVVAVVVILLHKDSSTANSPTATSTVNPNMTGSPLDTSLSLLENHILSLLPNTTRLLIQQQQQQQQQQQDPTAAASPQARALQWMLQDPYLLQSWENSNSNNNATLAITSHDVCPDYPNWRLVQRFALATLYYATNGQNWFNQQHWLDYAVHECEWFSRNVSSDLWPYKTDQRYACQGYHGDDDTNTTAAAPTTNQVYTKLWLHANNLQGPLGNNMEELYLLTSLTSLSLFANPLLQGTISTLIGKLIQLDTLYMASMGGLVGSIPTEIGLLNRMKDLQFLNSNLGGRLPSELGLLTDMEYLFLDSNQFSGRLPTELGNLKDTLIHLYLFNNTLSGQLPSEIGLLSHLDHLSLDDNLFSGTIPTEYGQLINCTAMNPDNNALTGTLPSELGLLPKIKKLKLGNNYFSGTLPTTWGQMSTMQRLTVNNNLLSGTIPTELSLFTSTLLILDVTHNVGLSGTIPSALCDIGFNVTCPWKTLVCGLSFDCSANLCGCQNCTCGPG